MGNENPEEKPRSKELSSLLTKSIKKSRTKVMKRAKHKKKENCLSIGRAQTSRARSSNLLSYYLWLKARPRGSSKRQ